MELMEVRDPMSDLYWAARLGDEHSLKLFLRQNASFIANIPDGRETPLHISALLDHVPFTEVLLNHDRNFAIRKDSCGRTALHLASAEGYIDIVKVLLQVNNEPCLNRDRQGRIPLHYAAMRGRTEVVKELIMARPDSLGLVDREQNTVFHLCVTYNHLNTLETLVKLDYATTNITAGQPSPPIFMLHDRSGNTILHLAIKFKRVEVVRYLVSSVPEIRELEKAKNSEGLIAYDILECSSKDLRIDEIKLMLTKEDDKEESKMSMLKCIQYWLVKILKWIGNRLRHGGNTDWLEEMRGNLSAASTFISSVTFQALINPPGGFIQQGLRDDTTSSSSSSSKELALNCTTLNDQHEYCPGEAALSFGQPDEFLLYLDYITLSFYASICVTLLLVSGVPLKNRAMIWILSVLMSFTQTFLALAYNSAAKIVTPKHVSLVTISDGALGLWGALLFLVLGFYSLRFIIWIVRTCYKIVNKLISCCC